MRIGHRIPVEHMRWTDEVTPEYQAEVDRSTAKIEKAYKDAKKRLAAAEQKAARVRQETVGRKTKKAHEARLAQAAAIVELRRIELEKYERMMMSSPQSAQHRGIGSHRQIPARRGGLV